MTEYNMLEAKNNLSKICASLESGKEDYIVIARNGKPIVKVIPYGKHKPVILGLGKKKHPRYKFDYEKFMSIDEEIADMFYGGDK